MNSSQDWQIAGALLRLTTQLVDGIQEGLAKSGFTDVRPVHGFVFVRISQGSTTVAELSEYLGVTKQAASQLVAQLENRGYVTRRPSPEDGRAQLLFLTQKGTACTRAAERIGAQTVKKMHRELPQDEVDRLAKALRAMTTPGPLRPNW